GGMLLNVLDRAATAGNRIKLIDPDNNETDWTYSATNLPLTETNALEQLKHCHGRVCIFDNARTLSATTSG
ncbi:MAG TPA: hypothetical protein VFW73_05500, partial [Lacipirellulaceae bacterium]|nr:hypothetical protein [Lacipirellulaceae bacterium]